MLFSLAVERKCPFCVYYALNSQCFNSVFKQQMRFCLDVSRLLLTDPELPLTFDLLQPCVIYIDCCLAFTDILFTLICFADCLYVISFVHLRICHLKWRSIHFCWEHFKLLCVWFYTLTIKHCCTSNVWFSDSFCPVTFVNLQQNAKA